MSVDTRMDGVSRFEADASVGSVSLVVNLIVCWQDARVLAQSASIG